MQTSTELSECCATDSSFPVKENNEEIININIDPGSCIEDDESNSLTENINTIYIIPTDSQIGPSQTELLNLLTSWNLVHLFNHLNEQQVSINHLKRMSLRQMDKLLVNFTSAIQIDFEFELLNWQRSLGITINCNKEDTSSTTTTVSSYLSNCTTPLSPISSTSTGKIDYNIDCSLRFIINKKIEGKMIVSYYAQHQSLNDENRKILADLIVDYYIENKVPLTTDACAEIASDIKLTFPSEEEVYYYQKRKNAAPSGRLYTKYHNRKNKFKTSGLVYGYARPSDNSKEATTSGDAIKMPIFTNKLTIEHNTSANDHIRALKYQSLSAEELIIHWKGSICIRAEQINKANSTSEIMELWPYYKNIDGYKLIDIDFSAMYNDTKQIFDEYEHFQNKIIKMYAKKIKDHSSKEILTEILAHSEDISEKGKCAAIFYILSAVLKPHFAKRVRADQGRHKNKKFSIRDSQESFCLHYRTGAELIYFLERKKNEIKSIQPFLAIEGEKITEPTKILVYFDDIKYIVPNVQTAIDIVFKIFFVFNLKYPEACQKVWQFIQIYFYKINLKDEIISWDVQLLIKELQNNEIDH